MNWYKKANQENSDVEIVKIPNVLYHATYRPWLESIQKNGLGATKHKQWSHSKSGVVYLTRNPSEAKLWTYWLKDIVILKIDTTKLDQNNFFIDSNYLHGDTLEYHGVIPFSAISICEID